jgi:tRNA G18 (ribose-2'-O)-methylase SpoU
VGVAGMQTDSQLLYQRQRQFNAIAAPAVIADGLRTPENMGAVLRLAEAAGSRSVTFVEQEAFDPCSPQKIRRTARGAEQRVQWDSCGREEFLTRPQSVISVAVEITGESTPIFEAVLPGQCALMIGNERHGISPQMLATCRQAVHVPMFGLNGSMNVTHALAVALFEWRRQQGE